MDRALYCVRDSTLGALVIITTHEYELTFAVRLNGASVPVVLVALQV